MCVVIKLYLNTKQYIKLTGNLKTLLENDWKNSSHNSKTQQKKTQNIYPLEKIYGTTSETYQKAKLNDLINWLSANSPASKAPSVPSSEFHLSYVTVKNIEKTVMSTLKINKTIEVKNVDERKLRWPGKVEEYGAIILPKLGARVVSIASSGSVKFGSFGTVVGVHPANETIEVLFDDVLQCGTNLDGSLSTLRGEVILARDLMIVI